MIDMRLAGRLPALYRFYGENQRNGGVQAWPGLPTYYPLWNLWFATSDASARALCGIRRQRDSSPFHACKQ